MLFLVNLVVVENFGAYYMEQKKREIIAKKRADTEENRRTEDKARQVCGGEMDRRQ